MTEIKKNNIFLTGEIQVGKSTAIKKVMENFKADYGGYQGYSHMEGDDKIIGFKTLTEPEEDYVLAVNNPKKQKFDIRRELFDSVLADALKKSLEESEIIIIDELGNFEENSEIFKETVRECLGSEKTVLGVLKKRHGEFVESIAERDDIYVFEVDESNRNSIPEKILEIMKEL